MKLRKKRFIIPLILLVGLIAFRIYLPTLVKNYVNRVLADLPGYTGYVEDIDIALIRGAYVIKGMHLNKINATSEVPFLEFPNTDISIQWKSLFKGEIVSEIEQTSPALYYVFEDQQPATENDAEKAAETPKEEDWSKALRDLVPIKINRYAMFDGKIAFLELQAEPNVDLHIAQLNLAITNLRNVNKDGETLPTSIQGNGVSIGGGALNIEGKANIIKQIPDIDISLKLEGVDTQALNDAAKHYAKINFSEGTFNFYSEVAIADGFLKGYVKPLFHDVKLLGNEDESFLEVLWEGFVGFFKFILENQKTENLGTRVPIEGDLNQVGPEVWPSILNIFKNAWIKALSEDVEQTVNFEDAKQAESDKE